MLRCCCQWFSNSLNGLLSVFSHSKNLAVFLPIVLLHTTTKCSWPLCILHPFHLFSEKISDAVLQKKKFLLLLLLRWSSQQAVAHHCQARNGLSIWSLKANKRILKGLILMKLAWAVVPSFQLPLQIKVKRNLRRPPVLASQNDYSRRGILYYSWLLSSCASVAQHITATNSKLGPNAFLLLLPLSNIFFLLQEDSTVVFLLIVDAQNMPNSPRNSWLMCRRKKGRKRPALECLSLALNLEGSYKRNGLRDL